MLAEPVSVTAFCSTLITDGAYGSKETIAAVWVALAVRANSEDRAEESCDLDDLKLR